MKKDFYSTISSLFDGYKIIREKGKNPYVPFGRLDHSPPTDYPLLKRICNLYKHLIKKSPNIYCNNDQNDDFIIAGEEERGGFLLSALNLSYQYEDNKNVPFTLAKLHPHHTNNTSIDFTNTYLSGKLGFEGIIPNQKYIIVDDLIDGGGTMIAVYNALQQGGAKPIGMVALGANHDNNPLEKIHKKTGIQPIVGCRYSLLDEYGQESDMTRVLKPEKSHIIK